MLDERLNTFTVLTTENDLLNNKYHRFRLNNKLLIKLSKIKKLEKYVYCLQ